MRTPWRPGTGASSTPSTDYSRRTWSSTTPSRGETYEGRDAFKRWVADVRAGFPDFEVDMAETVFVADEDHVASQWIVRGTHDGNLPAVDVEPTHESMELHGVTVYELEDGRVTEAWWHYDNVAFLAQLGIAPEALTA